MTYRLFPVFYVGHPYHRRRPKKNPRRVNGRLRSKAQLARRQGGTLQSIDPTKPSVWTVSMFTYGESP